MQGSPPPGLPTHDANATDYYLPPTRDDGTIPRTIVDGRYRIERVVGEGAFGRVYLAYDTRLKNHVAIKELLATRNTTDRDTYERYLERFQREARAVFALQHPNVVTVYEMHEDSAGNHYLIMEYVDGPSLRDLLLQVGTLSVERAVAIAIDLAEALAAIGERGIVHRDFKPANIMINKRGVAKLADFGVALIPSETVTRPLGVGHPGSLVYMSPEQETGGGPVDGRSDLYSLGLVLYEMLVGRRYAEVHQSLNVVRPDLSQQLVNIVNALLQPHVAWRYQSAQEVVSDLKQLSMAPAPQPLPPQPLPPNPYPPAPPWQPPPQAPAQSSKRWRGPVFGLTGITVAVVAVLIAVHVLPGPAPTPTATPARAASAAPTSSAAQSTPATVTSATITPATVAPATATLAPTATTRPATATPLPTSTPPRATIAPTSPPVIRTPIGAAPSGWKTYSGNTRAPFAVFYPPDWTVDESDLTKNGTVQFAAPNGGALLSISANTTRTTASIDTLRDEQAKSVAQICVRSGIEQTDRLTLSNGVIFDYVLQVCDRQPPASQIVSLVGAGLNNGYPWTFIAPSVRKDYNKNTCSCPAGNLEKFYEPILDSLRIYGNPVG